MYNRFTREVHTGPQGGRYYTDNRGRKQYLYENSSQSNDNSSILSSFL